MSKFRIWLEALDSERAKKVKDIWRKTFTALGIEGLNRQDVLPWSLSKITFGQDNPISNAKSTFKGKQAVLKRLTRDNIFQELKSLGDPELAKSITDTEQWLSSEDNANATTTVGMLLQKMYGNYFSNLLADKEPNMGDEAKLQKAPPQPPVQNNQPQQAIPAPQQQPMQGMPQQNIQ